MAKVQTPGPGSRFAPVSKPKNSKETLKRLWEYFGDDRRTIVYVWVAVFVGSILSLSIPYLIGKAIDSILGENQVNFTFLTFILVALFIFYLMDAALRFLQEWLMVGVSQHIVYRMRQTLFAKLHRLPIAFFDKRSKGELMSRLSNDVENINTTLSQAIIQFFTSLFMVLGSLLFMLTLSPMLTLASFVTLPFVFLLTKTISSRSRKRFKEQQVQLGRLNGFVEETISGMEVVKAFHREPYTLQAFKKINNKMYEAGLEAQVLSGFLMPLLNAISNLGYLTIATVGGVLAVQNMVTVGIIASFIQYSKQFTRPLNDLATIFNTIQSALAGAERMFEILDEIEEKDEKDAKELDHLKGDVTFDQVGFFYEKGNPILKEVSFHVHAGERIALVGPTGAGKTTIISLLTRFYDPTEGQILLDGQPIHGATRKSLRDNFAIVLQDTYLFTGTIMDNLRYGRRDATDEEIIEAAKKANVDRYIRRLPQGYETFLLESGSNISSGQRQLISIARAILADPAILILDEATSNVDTRTEKLIQEAMNVLMKGRTTFIIAHRLSTIQDADRIMVVKNQTILEAGNHDQLLEKGGFYAQMVQSQFVG